MKKIFIYILLVTTLVSCDDWLDVNTDPNNPTEVSPDLMLPAALDYTSRWLLADRYVNHLGNMMMYNWSETAGFSWYNDEFLYLVNSTFYDQIFDDAYEFALNGYQNLENLDPEVYGAYVGIGKIMQSYTFQILTDFYGPIPYFDALQRGANVTPEYDAPELIYADLLSELTAAITLLNDAESSSSAILPGEDDAVFEGNLTSWKQFANSIKLRILARSYNASGITYNVQTEMDAITAEGSGFAPADVMISLPWLNEEGKQQVFWEDFGFAPAGTVTLTGDATCASDFIITYLQDSGDPRIDRMFEEPADGHMGVPQGIVSDTDTQSADFVSNIGPGLLKSASQSSIIMTLAEIQLNRAELALAGFGGDPEALYNAGVAASFATLGASGSGTYLAQNIQNVNYAFSSNKQEAIIVQKWLATLGLTAEQSWFDWSRTGFPQGLPVSQEAANLVRPHRLLHPASELTSNGGNLPTQASKNDPNWWAN